MENEAVEETACGGGDADVNANAGERAPEQKKLWLRAINEKAWLLADSLC